MNAHEKLGFDRGSADKLAHRAYVSKPPSDVVGKEDRASYRRGYKRGYEKTKLADDAIGASASFSASASTSLSTSSSAPAPSSPPPAEPYDSTKDGFQATLPPDPVVTAPLTTSALKLLAKGKQMAAMKPTATPVSALRAETPQPASPPPMPTSTLPVEQTPPQVQPSLQPPTSLQTMDLSVPPATRLQPDASITDRASAWTRKNWFYLAIAAVAMVGGGITVFKLTRKPSTSKAECAFCGMSDCGCY